MVRLSSGKDDECSSSTRSPEASEGENPVFHRTATFVVGRVLPGSLGFPIQRETFLYPKKKNKRNMVMHIKRRRFAWPFKN